MAWECSRTFWLSSGWLAPHFNYESPGNTWPPPPGRPPGARCTSPAYARSSTGQRSSAPGSSTPVAAGPWGIPTRPLWPVKPSPRPAALVAASTLRPICLEESPKTGAFGSGTPSSGLMACRASAAARPMYSIVPSASWSVLDWGMCSSAAPSSRNSTSLQRSSAASDPAQQTVLQHGQDGQVPAPPVSRRFPAPPRGLPAGGRGANLN